MTIKKKLQVEKTIHAPIAKVWEAWNNPDDIKQWNSADPSWHCPYSENDLQVGGWFKHRMEAKDGRTGFDFTGQYDRIQPMREISYTMEDGRQSSTHFTSQGEQTHIKTLFDAESENDPEFQKQGWQFILENFALYIESKTRKL